MIYGLMICVVCVPFGIDVAQVGCPELGKGVF